THKNQLMAASWAFLDTVKDAYSLLDRTITGDETWVQHMNCVVLCERGTAGGCDYAVEVSGGRIS
ncbi:hypothetical protein J6590_070327, partial [Homalodisca vitripennis]